MTLRRRLPILALASLALGWMPGPAAAQQVIAFGDSLVEGFGDEEGVGVAPRLRKLLRKVDESANVLNFGLGGETTSEGLSRIPVAIAESPDIIIIMEGTNDVDLLLNMEISLPTVVSNLNQMVRRVEAAEIEPVLATIVWRPPTASADSQSLVTEAVSWEIRELAHVRRTRLLDSYRAFDPEFVENAFSDYYFKGFDPVGHLNGAGYQRMAEVFADGLLGVDNVSPVLGSFSPGRLVKVIPKDAEIRIPIYEPEGATGIDRRNTRLLINGRQAGVMTGNTRKLEIIHLGEQELGCRAVIQLQSADRAEEPNWVDRVLGVYDIIGRTVPTGDVDFDCRADVFDLVALSKRFGARRGEDLYNRFFDFNLDGIIDEDDIEILRRNFGRSS